MNRRFFIDGVDAQTPLVQAAPQILLHKAEPLFKLEDAARAGADMDAVHDMRVASRRLREAMRLLAPVYPKKEFRRWYRSVRGITRALGPVRDSDVFIDAFATMRDLLGEGGRRAVVFFVGFRMGQRAGELDRLNTALAELDLKRAKASFEKLSHSIEVTGSPGYALGDFAHAEVAQRAAVVFGAQLAARDEANITEQHALRIDYKRLRYAVEAFAPCYGDSFDELHQTLTAFQDALGDLHDTHIFLDMVREPERREAADRAGVSAGDVDELESLLERQAHERYLRFVDLCDAHPAEQLLPALLLPLVRRVEQSVVPVSPPEPDEDVFREHWIEELAAGLAGAVDEVPVAAPVDLTDRPWEAGWDEGAPETAAESEEP